MKELSFQIIDRETTRTLIDFPGLILSAETAFIAQSNGLASPPAYINMPVGVHFAHFKAGYLTGNDHFVMKYSGGFWDENGNDLGGGSGYTIVHNAHTGIPEVLFLDAGMITDYRTAAAGAVAAKYASKEDSRIVGVIGTGIQAHLQVEALTYVRPNISEVRVWGRHKEKIATYISDMQKKFPTIRFVPCQSAMEAIEHVDILITVTPSREPVVKADWISPGTHITAVGACAPSMQEHDPEVLKKATYIYADSIEKCINDGEIHHAVESGIISKDQICGELGQLIDGTIPNRKNSDDITFVDLVGLGIQDATAAVYLLGKLAFSS